MSAAIEGQGLVKSFAKKRAIGELLRHPLAKAERVHALRGVDLQVRRGEILGLLGPNGAGKTTLIKILSCLVLPDAGKALIGGIDTLDENRVKPQIGLVNSDERSFYWRLSGRENLRFFARLYDVPGRRVEARVAELLRRVDLSEAADRPFSGYSSGMKQRMAIARALLHDPPILLMDEPTRSLDPASALALRTFIRDELQRRDGKTVLLATHNLREAEVLADHVVILVDGRVRQVGTVQEVRRWGVQEQGFVLELEPTADALVGPFRAIHDVTEDGVRRVTVVLAPGARFDEMLAALVAARVPLRACDRVEPDLEQAFQRILAAEEPAP